MLIECHKGSNDYKACNIVLDQIETYEGLTCTVGSGTYGRVKFDFNNVGGLLYALLMAETTICEDLAFSIADLHNIEEIWLLVDNTVYMYHYYDGEWTGHYLDMLTYDFKIRD